MTVVRERLADRRNYWVYRFQSGDQHFTGGIGRFPDGRIAEIFINGSKVGSAAESNAQGAAIIVSLALQHGCALDTIRHALTRTGGAGGPLTTLLEISRRGIKSKPAGGMKVIEMSLTVPSIDTMRARKPELAEIQGTHIVYHTA
jgi:hypothetical protein